MKIDKSKIPAKSRVVKGQTISSLRKLMQEKGKPVEWIDTVKNGITETELADLLRKHMGAQL